MVVVEGGKPHLNEEVELAVTSSIQNNSGKMVFGKLLDPPPPPLPPLKVSPPHSPHAPQPAQPKSEKASA
jgi:hypothetical protein